MADNPNDNKVNPDDRIARLENQHLHALSNLQADLDNQRGQWREEQADLLRQVATLRTTLQARETAASRQVDALTRARAENRILRDQRDALQAHLRASHTIIETAYDHDLRGMSRCNFCASSSSLMHTALEPFERLSEIETINGS